MLNISGITTALVTPFDSDGSLDESTLRVLVDHQVAAGVTAIAVVAGCGEYTALTPSERERVVAVAVEQAAGRIKVLAGILEATTSQAVRSAKRFYTETEGKIDGLLVLTPYYIRPTLAGLQNHFTLVAQATDLPIVLYNNPSRTGISLDLDILGALCSLPTVIAIKECDRDLGRVAMKIAEFGQRLVFLCGDDDLCVPSWVMDSPGSIMAVANLVPEWCVSLYQSFQDGNLSEVRTSFFQLIKLISVWHGPGHPGPLKEILGIMGRPVGAARPPLVPMGKEARKRALRLIDDLGLVAS
jgi:4-hydroxy-tetrahydrodipicolinate synthase